MNDIKQAITEENLANFYGSEHFYRFHHMVITDGVKFLMDNGAAWLMDIIWSYQGIKKLQTPMLRDFQLWTLKVNLEKKTAVVTCRADSNIPPAITQKIPYTDFPLEEIKLYVENDTILLPSER